MLSTLIASYSYLTKSVACASKCSQRRGKIIFNSHFKHFQVTLNPVLLFSKNLAIQNSFMINGIHFVKSRWYVGYDAPLNIK